MADVVFMALHGDVGENGKLQATLKDSNGVALTNKNVAIIIDESTKIKNPDSKLTKDFFEIAPLFKIKVIMTGTPIANRPYDIWSQVYFLDNGESLGDDFETFKKQCDLSNDLYDNDDKKREFEDAVGSIYEKIRSFSVRETKNSGIITLPSKIYHDVFVGFEKEQFSMYEQVRKEMEILLCRNGESVIDESTDTIKRLLRLVQITSSPFLIDETYEGPSAKEIVLDQHIRRIMERGEKVIIWSIFIFSFKFLF